MDSTVIKKLADIDLAARSILADAGKEQEKLAEEYRAKTQAYDRELDEQSERELRTQKRLRDLRLIWRHRSHS